MLAFVTSNMSMFQPVERLSMTDPKTQEALAQAEATIAGLEEELRSTHRVYRDKLREAEATIAELRGCPHGDNCACAIGSRHFWHVAFCEERTANARLREALRCPFGAGKPTSWWSCSCGAEHQSSALANACEEHP
jgi:hypothetical protein